MSAQAPPTAPPSTWQPRVWEQQSPQFHPGGFNDYSHDPNHTEEHWEQAEPKMSIEEFMMQLEETHKLEAQLEFCKYHVEYGLLGLYMELAENDAVKQHLQTIEYDYHRLKDEIKLLEERNQKKAWEAGYYFKNTQNGAISTHTGISHQNQQGQWQMQHTQGQQFGQPGHPQAAPHPNLGRTAATMGLGMLGFRLPPPAPAYGAPPPRYY